MRFSTSKQNKTSTWQTRGFVRFWPIKYQPGPREPGRGARQTRQTRPTGCGRASGGAPLGRPPAHPPPAGPALPLAPPDAPRPSRMQRRRRWPGGTFPSVRARYLSSHLGGTDLRRAGSPVAPAAGPAPSRARGGEPSSASSPLPRQAPPSGARAGREPRAVSGSLQGRDKVSARRPDASRRRGRGRP